MRIDTNSRQENSESVVSNENFEKMETAEETDWSKEENEMKESGFNEEKQTTQTSKELEDLRESHLRLAADFENYKKHARKEIKESRQLGRDELVRDLAVIVSELNSAAKSGALPDNETAAGVGIIVRKLHGVLKEHGYERVLTVGEPMNPGMHEAVATVPSGDYEPGVIIEELTPGFMRGKRLVIPARVVVSR